MPDRGEVKRFVILAAPRTGSNMLSSLLHSHPDILCHHELYNPRGIFYALDLRGTDFSFDGMDIPARDANPVQFLQKIWQQPLSNSHVGFKMTHYQNQPAFDALLEDDSIQKVVLRREDQLATHVSRLIAEQRDIWEDYGDQPKKPPSIKVHVDPTRLAEDMAFNKAYYADIQLRLDQNNQQAYHITYESLSSSGVLNKLLQFLGCTPAPLQAKSRKQNPEPLKDLVSNYAEVSQLV